MAVGGQEAVLARRGSPEEEAAVGATCRLWGRLLSAAASQPSTDPGGEGAGRAPVLGALGFRTGHVAGGALGGQGRGFWAAPAQPLHPICQGVLYWANFRGEQLIVLEGTGDRKSLGTRRCGFYLFGSEERGLDAGQGVKASGRAEPWRGQSEAAEDTTQGTEVMLRGQSPRDGETLPS